MSIQPTESASDAVEWADPPPRPGDWSTPEALDALRANPGRWAIVARDVKWPSGSDVWQKGHPDFEVTNRGPMFGPYTVYVRYVGEVSP